ncbi:Glucosamine-1-phosphate guanylyltransferase [hydrothermal vent metagenome]|uniref:Glucosamine-1-phosphate guanylyltransferase n=1 Tax=hydrothermal vent metagenome TaxID=652676 RepID=A0A3B0Y498_9ZZZZ
MVNVDDIKLFPHSTIREALGAIGNGAVKFAIVVDADDRLIGTLTDGDVRRAILDGKTLEDEIETIYFRKPVVVGVNHVREDVIRLCASKNIYQVPVLDSEGRVVSIDLIDELLRPSVRSNKVVLMVGGLGTRLRPLTNNTPKPMLHVGGKPILHTILDNFSSYGFVNVVMCVNYKSHIIQDYFGDGSRFGVNIEYVVEENRMGTAGALSLIERAEINEPFFVMNGDLLTNVNFEHMLEYHQNNNSIATMCVREYDFQVPYGVVNINGGRISSLEEKPVHKFFVNAGIYMLEAECLDLVPENMFYDMPTLFEDLLKAGENPVSFPLREYWLDIGRIEEYEKANQEYYDNFEEIK